MTGPILICISEKARPLIPSLLEPKQTFMGVSEDNPDYLGRIFWLVESKIPREIGGETYREALGDDGKFESPFIGSSIEDCQKWALQNWTPVFGPADPGVIVFADDRTAEDGTVLVTKWEPGNRHEYEFHRFGVLPKEGNRWYDWRVNPDYMCAISTALGGFGVTDIVVPTYWGCREELHDENGVFDVLRAEEILLGRQPLPVPGTPMYYTGGGSSYFRRLMASQGEDSDDEGDQDQAEEDEDDSKPADDGPGNEGEGKE